MSFYLIFGKIPQKYFQLQLFNGPIIFRVVVLWVGFSWVREDVENLMQKAADEIKSLQQKNSTMKELYYDFKDVVHDLWIAKDHVKDPVEKKIFMDKVHGAMKKYDIR